MYSDQMGFSRAGSNPAHCEFFFVFFLYKNLIEKLILIYNIILFFISIKNTFDIETVSILILNGKN